MQLKIINNLSIFFLFFWLHHLPAQPLEQVQEITVDDYRVNIKHTGCQLQQPLVEKKKLILPLAHCMSSTAQLLVNHPSLKALTKVHWAQHDPNTVWIVLTFATPYQFELSSLPDLYVVCLPHCHNLAEFQQQIAKIRATKMMMFYLNGLFFQIPLEGMQLDEFLDRSIGHVPQALVQDGLPHFGSKRDDWQGKSVITRKHKGYDIYVDMINVIAAASGTVDRVGKSPRAGLYIKVHHGAQLYTVYVHLKRAYVKEGQAVKQGNIIGLINGPVGNAKAAQLHFEIKINDKSVDPLPFIEQFYRSEPLILKKINSYKKQLITLKKRRDEEVNRLLNQK
jgi:hypothetical protein